MFLTSRLAPLPALFDYQTPGLAPILNHSVQTIRAPN